MEFINEATGLPVVFTQDLQPEQVFVGNILTLEDEGGKQHFQVKSVEGFPEQPALLVPAKSNLPKVILLLGSLAALWFVIDWLIRYFTS